MAKDKKKRKKRRKAQEAASAADTEALAREPAGGVVRVLLTIPELCDYLGISRATLYRLDLPGRIKIGNQVRFHKPTIDRWILEQLR